MAGRAPDWLSAAEPLVAAGDIYGVNAPREFYGDFMEEQATAAITALEARGITITRVDDTVLSLELHQDGVTVCTASGDRISARGVDVATGGPSTMRIEGDNGAFSAPSVFGHEHRIAEHIKSGAEIFCIGGNAAMLDVLRLCQSLVPESALRFKACAPDGEVPAPLIPRLPRKLTQPRLTQGHRTAASLLAEIQGEIDRAQANGDEMREIRAGFRAFFLENPLSLFLSDVEQARKVPGQLRFWLRGGTRDTILDMHRLIKENRVQIVKGLVLEVISHDTGAEVVVKDDGGSTRRLSTGFVINCAGAGPNSTYDPMTTDLLTKGLLEHSAGPSGLKVGQGCQLGTTAVRYLSPAVSEIGDEVVAMPLYDAHMLRSYVARARQSV